MRITVVGASGRTGSHVVRLLCRQGHEVVAGVRARRRGDELAELGARPVVVDLAADPEHMVDAFAGSTVVINTAGAGDPDPAAVNLVDRDGSIAAIRAAERAGVQRFVQLSAQFADAPDQGDRLVRSFLMAKQVSDTVLGRSSLVWTVVRPGTLTDEAPTGRVKIGGHLESGSVPRADVAAVLVAALDEPLTEYRGFDVHGGDVPIPAALAALG
ncbi:Putative NADH-flavin reductase [Amycolatopsis arida]|uniref:Putative NADH-flavin reductase n=1 Tax=Amycolatopsis arida TaxID=587909 RepID=A0A1I5S8L3_9PSEU|nr:NAD(P)H-binding protein [Amycolatopsis arida]TDX85324.1 putative NADH-flavin reductase [Amycolatopsis arida]SFP67138.1 Putative NADH-flavin reductase [Amycolatopsis arida]